MGHDHSHHHNAEKNISTAFFLNAFFVVVELVGGLLTNSIAILSDALHDFGDCLSLGTAWFLQKKSKQGRDLNYSYGYKRFSLLGGIFLSGVLTVGSLFVLVESAKRIGDPQEVHAQGMLWLALVGIAINGAAALKIKRGTSLNERAVFLHIMEDVMGWGAVLVVSVVMMFVDLPILDPILSIGISIWVLSNVYKNLRAAFKILLQATPSDVSVAELEQQLAEVDGVESVHDLHVWSLDGESHVMTIHVVTEQNNTSPIKQAVLEVAAQHRIDHTTIEFEQPDSDCSTNCDQ